MLLQWKIALETLTHTLKKRINQEINQEMSSSHRNEAPPTINPRNEFGINDSEPQ